MGPLGPLSGTPPVFDGRARQLLLVVRTSRYLLVSLRYRRTRPQDRALNRLLVGIVIGIGSAFFAATGFDWPGTGPRAAASAGGDAAVPAGHYDAPRGPLVVHRPVPHPAVVAACQLFISLYVLIAQHVPREESA